MKKQRILLSSILTLFMFFSMFSFSVFADDRQQETETTEEPEQELTEDVPQTVNEESSNVSAGDSDSAESEEIIDDDNEISVTAEDILPDNDSLLEQYLNQALPHEEIQFRKKAAGDTLPGLNALLYQNLKQEIENVASGQRSSTEITVSLSDLELDPDRTWTAEDLGVEQLVVGGKIDSTAKQALYDQLDLDFKRTVKALTADLPYDLFWFDKTIGYTYSSFSVGAKTVYGEYVLYFAGNATVKFSVAEAYRYGNEQYQTDTDIIGSINYAIENAGAIVDEHREEDNYEKLVSYRQEICEAVSYNDEAASDDTMPYGNPWQLIWVFDGDPDTNVVCEGYSKAFKYLCDLSDFQNDISCIVVTGKMDGGNHMWNIVTMEDGENYLTDVTNCDKGSVGADDRLFLVGGTKVGGDSYRVTVNHTSRTILYTYDDNTQVIWDGTDALVLSEDHYVYDPSHIWVDSISLDREEVSMNISEEIKLTATILPADATNQTIHWYSDDETVASVDENGSVTAVNKGQTVIRAVTDEGGYTAECNVNVVIPVTGITIEDSTLTLAVSETKALKINVTPSNASNPGVTWESSDENVVTVDDTGTVKAVGKGTATITVTTEDGGFTAECEITVFQPVTGVTLDQMELKMYISDTAELKVTVEPSDADNQNVTWTSGNEDVATVDNNGKVTAVSEGTATIFVRTEDGGYTAECIVTVNDKQPVSGVELSEETAAIRIGNSKQLTATVMPEDADNQNVTWSSDNEEVATVDDTGKVTGKKPGTANITVTTEDGGYTDNCKVTVLFDDVTQPSQYYYDAVYWAVENDITQGMGLTTFNPGGFCKRYQFVLFLWRQAGCPEPELTEDPFKDVISDPNKAVYEKAVLWAVDQEITTGTTPTTFDPYAPLTRGQVVTFLYRAAGKPEVSTTTNPFQDLDSSKYYYTPVLWAVENEITTGLNATQFGPTNTCTRGQTVLFMYRLFK